MILLGLEMFLLLGIGSFIYDIYINKKDSLERPPSYNFDRPPSYSE